MKQYLLCLTLLSICFTTAQAQNKPTNVWSLADCIRYAHDHNLQVQSLQLNEQLAEQNLLLANGARIPSLYGTFTNSFQNAKNNVAGNGLLSQLTSSGTYGLSSSVILWNGNYVKNNILQQQLLVQSAALQVQQSLNNISLQITANFLSILLAKEYFGYIKDLVSTSEARVKQGEMFYHAGSIARKDLLQLQAQLASNRYLLVQTQNAIRQTRLLLRQSLQLPADIEFDIAPSDTVVVPKSLPSFYEVREAALQDFPDAKIGKLGVDIASFDMAKADAGFKPTLSAGGTLATGYSNVITNPVLPKTGYFTQTGDNFYQRIGLTLSIPIFSNYTNKVARARATIAYKEAQLNWQNDQLVLSQAVEQAYLNASNAIQSYDAASEQLNAAAESYRIANEQFRLGANNSYDLLQQGNQYLQAVQAFTQAKYTAVLQEKIYEFYLGKPIQL